MSKNKARDIERKITTITKNVKDAWEKLEYPNLFGGGPVMDPHGKLISLNITAFGHVAAFFEDEEIQSRLREAIRKNNIDFAGLSEENNEIVIKKTVDLRPPPPPQPIFLLKSYKLQSYLSTLIRFINKISGANVPGGLTWGLKHKAAALPSGWPQHLMDFYKYGGPGIKYEGQNKLPPMIKDVLVHYFYLLGLNPNDGEEVPDDYQDRDLDHFTFIPPPAEFVIPDWATPHNPDDESTGFSASRSSQASSSGGGDVERGVQEVDVLGAQMVDVSEAQEVDVSRIRVQAVNVSGDEVVDIAGGQAVDEAGAQPVDGAEAQAVDLAGGQAVGVGGAQERIILRLRVPPPTPSRSRRRRVSPVHDRSERSPPSPLQAAPQASSTLRSEYNLVDKSPVVLRLSKQRYDSKPAKKAARLSSSAGVYCEYCAEPVTELDLKSKNGLVKCSTHKVHKYCQQECMEAHGNLI